MPKLDGIETIGQMRRERPDAKIVAMSGGGQVGAMDFANAALQSGAAAAIEKPFDPKALTELLRALVPKKS